MENARLMERLEQGLEQERRLTAQLETLMGLTQLPQGNTSGEAIAQVLLDRIIGALEADGGFVLRESDNRFRVVASRHLPGQMREVFESRPADEFQFWRRLESAENGGVWSESMYRGWLTDAGFAKIETFDLETGESQLLLAIRPPAGTGD